MSQKSSLPQVIQFVSEALMPDTVGSSGEKGSSFEIGFPRIPWPASPDEFWDVSAKGTTLRKLHLMDPATIGPTPYPFKGEG